MGKVAASTARLVETHERAPRPFEAVRPDPHAVPLEGVRPDPHEAVRPDPLEAVRPDPLEALRVATAALSEVRAVERLAALARDAALRGLGADLLAFAVVEDDGRHLRLLADRHRRPPSAAISVDGPGVIAHVARSGRAMLQPSGEAVRTLRPGTESVAVVPLPAAEGPVGVMVFGRSGRAGFSPDERAFVDVLAGVCALALERLRLSAGQSQARQVLHQRRRTSHIAGTQVEAGRMRFDLERLRIEVDGRSAHLTPTEMRLLMFLADEPGRPRSRREILGHLWQTDHLNGERTCDAHISNLRRKVERDPSSPELVVTRRGVGYALEVA